MSLRSAVLWLLPLVLACTALESPRDRARKAVERLGEAGLSIELPSGETLVVPPGGVEVLAMDAYALERGGLEGFAQLSIEGRVGEVQVSYLGNERLEFRCSASACSVQGPLARRLEGVVETLLSRRRALEARDATALGRLASNPRPLADGEVREAAERPVRGWYVRVETDSAIVGEADPEGRQRRMRLRFVDGSWRFEAGLP